MQSRMRAKQAVEELLSAAGVRIDGSRPCDIHVHDARFFERILARGSLGLGESYMDGWWDCEALDQFFEQILSARLDKKMKTSPRIALTSLRCKIANLPLKSKAYEIGDRHYDIGNDLFSLMLDKRMNYSCAYWRSADNLDEAQEAKLEMICRKMGLQPGMRVLDIGCGWGAFCRYAAETRGVEVVGITVSAEQVRHAREICKGLPVQIERKDYREVSETFDRIVSVGMFEHVGARNYRNFMRTVRRRLRPGGMMLLHTIAGNTSVSSCDPWISTYIFPNSMLPSARQIAEASEGLLVLEDWHSFGPDYDRTLMAWRRNFESRRAQVLETYGQRFYRMWDYYLLSCAGSFRARRNQLWQIVFSRNGVRGGWRRPVEAFQAAPRHREESRREAEL